MRKHSSIATTRVGHNKLSFQMLRVDAHERNMPTVGRPTNRTVDFFDQAFWASSKEGNSPQFERQSRPSDKIHVGATGSDGCTPKGYAGLRLNDLQSPG